MEILGQLHQITGDTTISILDMLITHQIGEDEFIVLYETRSDYLYMAHVKHGKIMDVSTYESLGCVEVE